MGIAPFAFVVCLLANAVQAARRPSKQTGDSDHELLDDAGLELGLANAFIRV